VKVSVLISTYNGERYLKEQLKSLFLQTFKNIQIIVRDDFSNDATLGILSKFDVKLLNSDKNIGTNRSFSLLLKYALEYTDSQYFMFCDQDDIWDSTKVENTLAQMQELESNYGDIPLLVHTDLVVVDEKLQIINNSFMKYQNLNGESNNFNELLVQNTITGCTVMINRKLALLANPIPCEAKMHDIWLGLVASKFGKIYYIPSTTIKYRQHSKNTIGATSFNIKYIMAKVKSNNVLDQDILQAEIFLKRYRKVLDKDSIEILEEFISIKSKSFLEKRKILLKYKLLKQGLIRNIGLLLKI